MAFSPDDLAMEMGVRTFGAAHAKQLAPVDSRGGWHSLIREPYTGAWQKNEELTVDTQLTHYAVFSCTTLISADIGKLRIKLVGKDQDGIWSETESAAYSPVLRRPNRYQNHIQFKEHWITSKLSRGNAYVLKQRDNRNVVTALYVLDPGRVTPLVAPDGSVFYRLKRDDLSGLGADEVTVPAKEIIHDRMNCLFHPLVGISPLYASGMAAGQGLSIQSQSRKFFDKGARPSGVLTAPDEISQTTADRLKAHWESEYSGNNAGKVAVLGDGLHYEPMMMTAIDSQMVEQLKMAAEIVCATFHVPAFKVGLGSIPAGQKVEDLNAIYYSDCLQSLIEAMELCLDEGLGIGEGVRIEGRVLGTELDLDDLLRMDTATLMKTWGDGVGFGVASPNEARRRFQLKPVAGGDTPYLQQQNYSLAALDKRDQENPLGQPPLPAPTPEPEQPTDDEQIERFVATLTKALEAA